MSTLKQENKPTILKEKMNIEETLYAMKICNDFLMPETSYELSLKFIHYKDYSNFSILEQKLLSDIWHNYILNKKKCWKSLVENIETESLSPGSYTNFDDTSSTINKSFNKNLNSLIEAKVSEMEEFIQVKCMEIVSDIDRLIEKSNNARSTIHYTKIKADFVSYYSEVANEEEFGVLADECQKLYQESFDKALELPNEDYLYLSIAYFYADFLSSVLNYNEKAYTVANKAYMKGKKIISNCNSCSDFEFYLQMLESKLVIWKTELLDFDC
jgi:hypothetical protein